MKWMKSSLDAGIATLLGAAAFAVFAYLGLQLAKTSYLDYVNLAFDFDPAYFVAYLTGAPVNGGFGVNYKHPLWMLFRPFGSLFLACGFAPKEAAELVMSLFGGLTVALAYAFLRLARTGRPEAVAGGLFFAASSTTLLTSMVVESYGWVNFSLAVLWCTYLSADRSTRDQRGARVVAAALVAGVTITNVLQALIAEAFLLRNRRVRFAKAAQQLIVFGVLTGLLVALVIALYQPAELWTLIQRPVQTVKEVYWQRTKGDTVGLWQLFKTYFVYSFFAPAFDFVRLAPTIDMLDFRRFSFTPLVFAASLVWCLFTLGNVVLAWRSHLHRTVLLGLIGALVFNLLFHLDYQFRGSVYIYAAHLHFLIFALGLSAASWVRHQRPSWRWVYTGMLLLFAGIAFANNIERAGQWIARMEHLQLPANAPEVMP